MSPDDLTYYVPDFFSGVNFFAENSKVYYINNLPGLPVLGLFLMWETAALNHLKIPGWSIADLN
jgi:hypothetical protein